MSDRELGETLLKLDLARSACAYDPQVDKLLEADRKRVKWLTRASIALWILAAVGALAVYVITGLALPAIRRGLEQTGQLNADPSGSPLMVLAKLTAINTLIGLLSFVVLIAAGLVTVMLVVRSRRAMLRQVNANLLQIAEQLKRLEPPGRGSSAAGTKPGS